MLSNKEFKSKLIDSVVLTIKKCNIFNLSDKSFGFFIRAFHVNMPLYLFFFMIYGTKVQNIIILFILILAIISFIYFNGCILSKVENKIDGEDITIIDPFLGILRMEKTNKNRMTVSYITAFIYLSFAFLCFNYRFGSSIRANDFINEYNKVVAYIVSFFYTMNLVRYDNMGKEQENEKECKIIPFDELSI
jgi:hypothetical protein